MFSVSTGGGFLSISMIKSKTSGSPAAKRGMNGETSLPQGVPQHPKESSGYSTKIKFMTFPQVISLSASLWKQAYPASPESHLSHVGTPVIRHECPPSDLT